jgi:hypothetical protein
MVKRAAVKRSLIVFTILTLGIYRSDPVRRAKNCEVVEFFGLMALPLDTISELRRIDFVSSVCVGQKLRYPTSNTRLSSLHLLSKVQSSVAPFCELYISVRKKLETITYYQNHSTETHETFTYM